MLNLILAAATAHGAEHADPSIGGIIHAPFIVAASMTVVLGIMLWTSFPLSGPWALGILLGLKLLMIGIIMLTGGSAVKSLAKA